MKNTDSSNYVSVSYFPVLPHQLCLLTSLRPERTALWACTPFNMSTLDRNIAPSVPRKPQIFIPQTFPSLWQYFYPVLALFSVAWILLHFPMTWLCTLCFLFFLCNLGDIPGNSLVFIIIIRLFSFLLATYHEYFSFDLVGKVSD